jgi:hypothetical protein
MSYQSPQPPSGPPAQPPNAGRPAGSFDPSTVNRLDWAILGIGFIVFIFSFFDYYTWDFMGVSGSRGAWHWDGGLFVAWFAMAVTVLAAAVLAVSLFAPTVSLPADARVLSVVGFTIGFVLYLIAIFAHDDFGGIIHHGFSFWLSLVLAGVGAVVALMRAQQTGTALPGPYNNIPRIGK